MFIDKTELTAKMFTKIIRGFSTAILLLGTILMPIVILPFTRDALNLPKQLFLYSIILLLLILWVVNITMRREVIIRRTVFDVAFIIFLAAGLVSTIFSSAPSISLVGDTGIFLFNFLILLAYILWFWLFVQTVNQGKMLMFFVDAFLFGGILSGIYFLLIQLQLLQNFIDFIGYNSVSNLNSVFGVYMALVGIISIGLLSLKNRNFARQILPVISLLISIFVLSRLGFIVSWVIFASGLGLLIILGIIIATRIRIVSLSIAFFLFLITLIFIFFGTPDILKRPLPTELSLGARPSWDIAWSAVFEDYKSFLLGSGFGTFVNDFSKYKSPAFNMSDLGKSVRFDRPYNSFLFLLSETGLVGFFVFFFIILIFLGSTFTIFPTLIKSSKFELFERKDVQSEEMFVVIIAWIAATIGLGVAFYDITLWWAWWWLLAAGTVGMSFISPNIIHEKKISLRVSPHYSLVLSFGLVLAFTVIIVLGIFAGKLYLAEISYNKSLHADNFDEKVENINRALIYRPDYYVYHIDLANLYLEKAQILSLQEEFDSDEAAKFVSLSVEHARKSADSAPHNVETWETLARMYINARIFTKDANTWAKDALGKAIELEPSNFSFYWQLGGVYVFDGDLERAVDSYNLSIQLKPDYTESYLSLADVYEKLEKVEEAILVYEPIFDKIQNNPELLFNLGRLFYNRDTEGDANRAEQVWLQAVKLEPNYANVLYSLGLLYEKEGEIAKAKEYFGKVLGINPGSEEVKSKIRNL